MEVTPAKRGGFKAVVTRRLGALERAIAEDDITAVQAGIAKCKAAFDELEAVHDAFHAQLEDKDDVDSSVSWFRECEIIIFKLYSQLNCI
jgi:hypothetical protein